MKGKDLKLIIKRSGITQKEAADILHVSRQTLNTWCKQELVEDALLKNLLDILKEKDFTNIDNPDAGLESTRSNASLYEEVITAKDALIAAQAERIKAQEEGIKTLLSTIKSVEENTFIQIERVEKYVVSVDARISEFLKSVKNQKVRT